MRTLTYSACSTHCSTPNKKSTVVGFMYKYVSCNDNFTFVVSHTLTSSTFRSWCDDDDGTVALIA